jgi:tetratricopeptide (TPR) repeat protein
MTSAEVPTVEQALRELGEGRVNAAATQLLERLRVLPQDAAARHLYGVVLLELGQALPALQQFDKALALQPGAAFMHYNRGNALTAIGRHGDAAGAFAQATALRPEFVEAWFNRGVAMRHLGRPAQARAHYEQAVLLRPALLPGHLALARVCLELDQVEAARQSSLKALELQAQQPEALNLLGVALHRLGQIEAALGRYEEAIALDPAAAEAWNNRGNALHDLGRSEEALDCFQKALALRPGYPEAINNRGMIHQELGRLGQARTDYDQAIAWRPGYRAAYQRRAALSLLQGRLGEGWADYEYGHAHQQNLLTGPGAPPFWEGQDLRGKSILLSEPNGLGDTLQFFRFVPELAARGARVSFFGPRSFFSILSAFAPTVRFIEQAATESFDFQCWLWSLPHYLGVQGFDQLATGLPWLKADPERVLRWSSELDPRSFNIGISWQGNPDRKIDRARSIPLRNFEPRAQLPGVRLVSLQKGFGVEQLQDLPAGMQVQVPPSLDEGPDAFVDTAALLQSLDLLVCADTSITHLAGAMGHRTWLALNTMPDWRWMLDREDSPWYPCVRLFRQQTPGDWAAVLAQMARALEPEVARRRADRTA